MSRAAHEFKQTNVVKALKAARTAGLDVHRFEIDRAGKIVVITGKPGADDTVVELVAQADTESLVAADEGWNDAP
jgi:hypothetical protein